jgi:hypothetical protein
LHLHADLISVSSQAVDKDVSLRRTPDDYYSHH